MKKAYLLFALLFAGCSNNYSVHTTRISGHDYGAVKMNDCSGESWYMKNGSWIQILDEKPIPKSHYSLSMTSLDNDWAAIRTDTKNGKSWRALSGKWIEIQN